MQGSPSAGLNCAARNKAVWFELEEQMEEREVWETGGPGHVPGHHTSSLEADKLESHSAE